eukprot:TRINITY_DN24438_c0_g1_i11.p1 TRINITY_DN24438_c0_g1~~TRINITY_DN24438_c0_g1_i11.p1  ORF type:complete len:255 (+),score=48.22 TRINITY_DN24438_c0_g1_i11:352-1116(+)
MQEAETGTEVQGYQLSTVRRSRTSWLHNMSHPLIRRLNARAAKLFGVDASQVEGSGGIQVAQYDRGGFYRPHFDSSPPLQLLEAATKGHGHGHFPSRARVATLLYVLRGTESGMAGGSLNFPLHGAASNLTHRNFLEAQGLTPEGWARECNHGLVVPVKRGDGVLWYNHVYRAGKVGALDEGSFHGGCLVRRGEKWIANHWLEMSPPYEVRSLDDEIAAAMALLQSMKESLLDDGEVEDAVEVSRVVRLSLIHI